MNTICAKCDAELRGCHRLQNLTLAAIKNGSKTVDPTCSRCDNRISVEEVRDGISAASSVVIVTGTAGAGKSAIGQYIERLYGYVQIDGDAVNSVLKLRAKTDPTVCRDEYLCHREVIRTMLITLGLGYDVIISYVIELDDLKRYRQALDEYGVPHAIRALIPEREVCLKRDSHRAGWTAGAEFVDKWHRSFEAMASTCGAICIDTSRECLEETVARHFVPLLRESKR